MNEVADGLREVLTWLRDAWRSLWALLMVPTVLGGLSAALKAVKCGKKPRQVLLEAVGGAVAVNVLGPIITAYTASSWHYTLYFLVGWGGLGLVEWAYGVAQRVAEERITRGGGSGEE